MMFPGDLFPSRVASWVMLGLAVLCAGGALAATDGFLPNDGRLDDDVLYFGSSPLLDVFFTADGVMFDLKDATSLAALRDAMEADDESLPLPARRGHALLLSFAGDASAPTLEPSAPGQARHSFFHGNDSRQWQADLPGYHTLVYRDLWPGVDLEFQLQDGRLEYRLLGDGPADALIWSGAEDRRQGPDGLQLVTPYGNLLDDGSRIGRAGDDSDDLVFAQRGAGALLWSTLAGGSADDSGNTLAVAADGDIIIAGETSSPDYPATPGAYEETFDGFIDVFVSRFADQGSQLLWSTFLGTGNNDYCNAIVLDEFDNPIIAGRSAGSGYPTTSGALDTSYNGGISDATLTKLSADGSSLLFSTFVGGSDVESFFDVALDASGNLVCVGYTASTDYPTSAGCFQNSFAGPPYDQTISILSPDGSTLLASTYLGGSDRDACRGVALGASGDLFLSGFSFSTDFPVTPGTFQTTKATIDDAALTRMTADLTTVVWATYIGGDDSERALAIDLDADGDPVIAGFTNSSDFPTSSGVLQETAGTSLEGFVAKFHAADGTLDWSTYLGGMHVDEIVSVQLDAADNPLVTGWTTSPNFPVNDLGYDTTHNGGEDIFVSRLSADGSALLWGTFLGGSDDDRGLELAVDADDNPVVTGLSESPDYPASAWAFDGTHGGGSDAILARFDTGDASLGLSSATTQIGCGLSGGVTFSYNPDVPHTPALRGYSVRIVAPQGLSFTADDIAVLSPIGGVNDTFQIIENAPGDCTIDFSFLDQGTGLDVAADLFTIGFLGEEEGVSTVAVAEGVFRDVDNHPFDVDIQDTLDLTVDCSPPAAPLLDAEPPFTAGTENLLSWTDQSGGDAVEFNVQASTLADFSILADESGFLAGLDHTFTGLSDSTTYHFRVFARDANGQVSEASATESSTQDATAPVSAAGALPAAVPATFDVPFTAADGGSGVASVELFASFDGGAYLSAGVFTEGPIAFTAGDGDGLYAFYTVATDSVGNVETAPAAADASTLVDTTAPDVPTLDAEPAYTAADSNTVTCSDESASGAVAYNFQISETADFSVPGGESGAVSVLSHTFSGLGDGITYYYRVAAIDSLGNASDYSVVVGSTQDAGAPVSSAGALDNQAVTSFVVPFTAEDAGSGVASVELFASFDGGAFGSVGVFTADPAPFEATSGEGLYGFYTVATDSLGNVEVDPVAAQSSCLVDLTAPSSAVDSLAAYQTSGVFALTATADDNLTGIAGFEWFYSQDAGPWISAGTSTAAEFEFTAPADGAFGFYCVATDSVGNVEAAPTAADATTEVDTAGPTGSFNIDNDAVATNDTTVTLHMTISGAVEMRFSNDNIDFPLGWTAFDTTAVWNLPDLQGQRTVYGQFRDDAGNQLALSDSILYDLQATGAVTFLDLAPAHQAVQLTWHDPDDADLVSLEIWRGLRRDGGGDSAYPEYDAAILPETPGDRAAALASTDWELAGTVPAAAQAFSDSVVERGIYHYEVFAVDSAGNFSTPVGTLPAATNYILGDMAEAFDGLVDVGDLTVLASTYGLGTGETGFNPHADVGPTSDFSGSGLPLPDDVIDFDDLMITTNNYGLGSKSGRQDSGAGTGPVLLAWRQTADNRYTLYLEDAAADLVGINLAADLQPGEILLLEKGELCGAQDGPVFLKNIPGRGLDAGCAVLGQGVHFTGTGALLSITVAEGADPEALQGDRLSIQLRDSANRPLEFAFEQASALDLPQVFALEGNHPNPFNPQTSIRFSLPQQETVRLEIYSIAGRRVAVLLDENLAAGHHTVTWTGQDEAGHPVASGVYFYRIRAGEFSAVRKMTLMK